MIITLTEDDLTDAVKDWIAKNTTFVARDEQIAFNFTADGDPVEWDTIEATVDYGMVVDTPEKATKGKPKPKQAKARG